MKGENYIPIKIVHSIITKALWIIESSVNDADEGYSFLRDILLMASFLEKPLPYRLFHLVNNYLLKKNVLSTYRGRLLANYLMVHNGLSRRVNEEIGLLRVQAPESIGSRLSLILSSLNRWIPVSINDLLTIKRRFTDLLSVAAPPWADHGRLIDSTPGDMRVGLMPGTMLSSWILLGLYNYLVDKGIDTRLLICSGVIDDYINKDVLRRISKGSSVLRIEEVNCSSSRTLLIDLARSRSLVFSFNYIIILAVIDAIVENSINRIDTSLFDRVYVGFNPTNTPLEQLFRGRPVVIASLGEIINLLRGS